MANLTLYVPDDVKELMEGHKEIRWSNVVRNVIERKLRDLDEADKLAKKSVLTEEDVRRISSQIDKSMGKLAQELLDEISS